MRDFDKWWADFSAGMENKSLAFAVREVAQSAWSAAQPEWQPAETAPDNTPVLVYWEEFGLDFADVASRVGGIWVGIGRMNLAKMEPMHWMPLPEPPEQ